LRIALISLAAVLAAASFIVDSTSAWADGPVVRRDGDSPDQPKVRVEDDQQSNKPKRNGNYRGVVPTEKAGSGGGATTTVPQLRRDSSLEEFINAVCSNQGQYFEEPTYIPACGELPAAAPATDPANNRVQAEDYARHYLQIVGLDKPRPQISAQNGGICGVEHSLDLNMRMERAFEDGGAPYGTLNIHAYSIATVNWGDGLTGRYSTSGGPWPNKSIAHAWTDRGYYDINVAASWSAAWSMGPYSGVLTGIPASASINDFRVWEAQAMLVK
jgi:hypothetical protein